jgi:hypothetical protein
MTGNNNEIVHPPHYTQGSIECVDAMRSFLGLEGFVSGCRMNAVKYIWRAGLKDDREKDLRKAIWFLQRAVDEISLSKTQGSGDLS